MCNWVRFSDRLPTEADADIGGNVIVLHPDNSWYIKKCYGTEESNFWKRNDLFWLANVPRRPKPRTLEDVVRDYLTTTFDRRSELEKEMKEILEKGLDNQDS